ncbi:antirepressor regulating drug resistance protein [Desulfosporosinus orientis DSM 765]|uniref:Antirepressor regulating drug resistance protein n=1 Tax=Desulfosporosinus orientis (strain ATCC 19365 / DSM 765 / NCIMB 8382 / VKM B-1628 / Singapore I) TaxID=768706 RepID=G7W8U9_DESOD|nr:antirepressor regulating drug resistance protein [Desulfosporosinus orientis]AET67809.1 antirepressor regulating drug resistance protein [Desulfosporosinus orientis DSM 765]
MEILPELTANILEITFGVSFALIFLFLLGPVLNRRYIAKWRYWVWLILAVRLLVPINPSLPAAPVQIQMPGEVTQFSPVSVQSGETHPQAAGPASLSVAPLTPEDRENNKVMGLKLLSGLWATGMVLFLLWQLAAYGRFRRFIRRWSRPVTSSNAYDMMAKLKEELKITSAVQLIVCPPINSPLLTGVFRPLIVLPHEEYTESDWFFILKHELIHHKRHDIPYKLLILAANMVHWFNPLVWLMVRRSNKDLEISCDDAIIAGLNWEERGCYSDTMMAAIIKKSPKAPALSTHFLPGTKAIKERFVNIFDIRKKQKGLLALFILTICLAAAGTLVGCKAGNKPDIKVTVLLQDLTDEDYLRVGTGEIYNPTIQDFKKLTIRLDTHGVPNRSISFPTSRDLQDLFTSDVYWFGRSESMDPKVEDVYYLLESTLYTRNVTPQEIREKLKNLEIDISNTDQQGKTLESTYNLADYFQVKGKISGLNQAGRKQKEELESLIGREFPETVSRKQGVLISSKLIPQSVIPQDDLLLALIMNEGKMGQSGISLLVLDHDLNLIGKCDGEIPLSPGYSVQTFRSEGYNHYFRLHGSKQMAC